MHGLMDRLMQMLDIKFSSDCGNTYQIKAANGKCNLMFIYNLYNHFNF